MPSGIARASRAFDGRLQGREATAVVHHACASHRAAEVHKSIAAQDEPTDVAIVAIAGIFEAETAFEPEAPILATAQSQAVGMDGFVEPLHAGGPARIAAYLFSPFGGAPGRAPQGHSQAQTHHQDQ